MTPASPAAPTVTVLMPVYNAERYLALAIDSVLAQTFDDFEFLIIDDGSTDDTRAILARYDDPRLVLAPNDTNMGIVRTLNKGLELARGRYIARMDADDICLPRRFERQVAYLDAHPECVLVGTRVQHIDETGDYVWNETVIVPVEIGTPGYIHWSLLWLTAITHPTVMFRRQAVLDHDLRYDRDYETAEDYELWTRFARHGAVVRLPESGLHYRINSASISRVRAEEQFKTHYRITRQQLARLMGAELPPAVCQPLYETVVRHEVGSQFAEKPDLAGAIMTLIRIRRRFEQQYTPTQAERDQIHTDMFVYLTRLYEAAKAHRDYRALLLGNWYLLWNAPAPFVRRVWLSIRYRARLLRRAIFSQATPDEGGDA